MRAERGDPAATAVRVLTVRQPWAWAIVAGHKDVENRGAGAIGWRHRGRLLIHAAGGWNERGRADFRIRHAWSGESPASWRCHGPAKPYHLTRSVVTFDAGTREFDELEFSCVVGDVELVDVHRAEPGCCTSMWAEYEYVDNPGKRVTEVAHLVLERPRRLLEPVPTGGALGLWAPNSDLLELVDDGRWSASSSTPCATVDG